MVDNPLLSPDHELPKPHEMQLESGTSEKKETSKPNKASDTLPRWLVYLVPLALLLIFAVSLYALRSGNRDNTVRSNESERRMPISPTISQETQILSFITQSYKNGVTWQPAEKSSFVYTEYDQQDEPYDRTLPALKITGTGKIDVEKTCYLRCESAIVKKFGWKEDSNQAADGPAGSLWGYRKEFMGKKQVLRLAYTNQAMEKNESISVPAPYEVTYEIFLSQPF